uniref:Uncharacterized protein n=1 Tax=Anguilla anguilla TaxID=7936 RepID=A0A0E9R8R0_ANGAN
MYKDSQAVRGLEFSGEDIETVSFCSSFL